MASITAASSVNSTAAEKRFASTYFILILWHSVNDDTARAKVIDEAKLTARQTELLGESGNLRVKFDILNRFHAEDSASRVSELSQRRTDKWLNADVIERPQILDIVLLNSVLDGRNSSPHNKKKALRRTRQRARLQE